MPYPGALLDLTRFNKKEVYTELDREQIRIEHKAISNTTKKCLTMFERGVSTKALAKEIVKIEPILWRSNKDHRSSEAEIIRILDGKAPFFGYSATELKRYLERCLEHLETCWRGIFGKGFENHMEKVCPCPHCGSKLEKFESDTAKEFDLYCTKEKCGVHVNCKSQLDLFMDGKKPRDYVDRFNTSEGQLDIPLKKSYLAYGNVYTWKIVPYSEIETWSQYHVPPIYKYEDVAYKRRWNHLGQYEEKRRFGSMVWEPKKKPKKKKLSRWIIAELIRMWNRKKEKSADIIYFMWKRGYSPEESVKQITLLRKEGHPVKKRRMITVGGKLIKV